MTGPPRGGIRVIGRAFLLHHTLIVRWSILSASFREGERSQWSAMHSGLDAVYSSRGIAVAPTGSGISASASVGIAIGLSLWDIRCTAVHRVRLSGRNDTAVAHSNRGALRGLWSLRIGSRYIVTRLLAAFACRVSLPRPCGRRASDLAAATSAERWPGLRRGRLLSYLSCG